MGRTKLKNPIHNKKRPRIEDENDRIDNNESLKAIEILRQIPTEDIEQAAADATRAAVSEYWPHLLVMSSSSSDNDNEKNITSMNNERNSTKIDVNDVDEKYTTDNDNDTELTSSTPKQGRRQRQILSSVPSWANGLGIARDIPQHHFIALQKLQTLIKQRVDSNANFSGSGSEVSKNNNNINNIPTKHHRGWSSWSGHDKDPRKRAFGFLPNTLGARSWIRSKLDITMPFTYHHNKERDDHTERQRNENAFVVFQEDDISNDIRDAIQYICDMFRLTNEMESSSINNNDDNEHMNKTLSKYLQYHNLIAAQPNLHNGRSLLPIHLDHPLKDGFGIIIVTIAIKGNGQILIEDYQGEQQFCFPLKQQQTYMLSDNARNACAHGVLADLGHEFRESLNLRFGLHDLYIKNDNKNDNNDDVEQQQKLKKLQEQDGVVEPVDKNIDRTTESMNTRNVAAAANTNKTKSSEQALSMIPSSQVLEYWEK